MQFNKITCWSFAYLLFSICIQSSCARSTEVKPGSLTCNLPSDTFQIGNFSIYFQPVQNGISVSHSKYPNHLLWSTIPNQAFLGAGSASGYFEDKRGAFILHEKNNVQPFLHQTIETLKFSGDTCFIEGELKNSADRKLKYRFVLTSTAEDHLQWKFSCQDSSINRLYVHWAGEKSEHIIGMGEQPSHFNHKGNVVPVLVQEQGIGRGDIKSLPINLVLGANKGNDYTTYKAVPHYISSRGQSVFLENDAYSEFDFSSPERISIKVFDNFVAGRILPGKTPAEFIESYTLYAGRMRVLPDWVHSGAIVGMQGGTEKVKSVWRTLQKAGVPITAFWLQDWVGQRKTILGKQLWWNWELDSLHYPDWNNLYQSLAQNNIAVMGYINPFLVNVKGEKPNFNRNFYQEALDSGFLVLNEKDKPYLNVTSFKAALLDLSHPGCRVWVKSIIKSELIANGFKGWMSDFGEALPFDVKLSNVRSTASYHNKYAQDWAEINREAIEESGKGDEITFFSRSAYTRSPAFSTLFWQGDQMVNWGKNDGLPSAVTGLLSAGVSGFSFNHSDIGGYASVNFPIGEKIVRSKELLVRWMQLSAFTPVYRTHEGLGPEVNHQVYSDSSTAHLFAKFAKVFQAWKFYRDELIQEAAQKGLPVVRAMALVFPQDAKAWANSQNQFMVGTELLIVPVLTPQTSTIDVYLPAGTWINIWNGKSIKSKGESFQLSGFEDNPGVFYPENSQVGEKLKQHFSEQRLIDVQ